MALAIKSLCCYTILSLVFVSGAGWNEMEYETAVGDPGMRRDGLRVAIEAWNQCNEVGQEAPNVGSPRAADCFDVVNMYPYPSDDSIWALGPKTVVHKVTEEDNKLGLGKRIPGGPPDAFTDIDQYAAQKEIYLGSKCQVEDTQSPWQFWMIMLKNGNMDTYAAKCPMNGFKAGPYWPDTFPCFGAGCMNPPTMHHNFTGLYGPNRNILRGSFHGSWDLDANGEERLDSNKSYYFVKWEKKLGHGSWVFHHFLKTSRKYPWLMLYLRSDATTGFSGGYHYETRGMSKIVPESPYFKVRYTLNVIQGGGPSSQFYLLDMGSCWKNNGKPCDGNPTTDVTRYSEMILNPDTKPLCNPTNNLGLCPPYHTFPNGTLVYRNNTKNFPYGAYHLHCAPGNAEYLEQPVNLCDPFSNPTSQEILQILPHPVWGDYGYPTKQGEGWIGDSRTWELDVGRMSQNLYFYQDPGTPPAKRRWPSIDVGTEIFKDPDQVAEWTVSDFDILIPKKKI